MISTVCPYCDEPENTEISKITNCTACGKPFVCINVYCASRYHQQCKCWNYVADISHLGTRIPLSHLNALPFYLKADKALDCFECGHSWGLKQAVIYQQGNNVPRPFKGHLIVPLEECNCLKLFHGTAPDRLKSIHADGLRPPSSPTDKSHGFNSEGSLRYTGRSREPAENHSEDNCIIELSYSGLIALTSLTPGGEALNLLLDNLPKDIGGIQYIEDGLSIAFRPEAKLHVINMPPIPKAGQSFIFKFREWICNFF